MRRQAGDEFRSRSLPPRPGSKLETHELPGALGEPLPAAHSRVELRAGRTFTCWKRSRRSSNHGSRSTSCCRPRWRTCTQRSCRTAGTRAVLFGPWASDSVRRDFLLPGRGCGLNQPHAAPTRPTPEPGPPWCVDIPSNGRAGCLQPTRPAHIPCLQAASARYTLPFN